MKKIGEFIYPWGNGHFSRMMRLNQVLPDYVKDRIEIHYSSKDPIYTKLLKMFPEEKDRIHEILMPTPIDGKSGPSVTLSMLNLFFPVRKNSPLVKQVTNYLKEERELYDSQKFDVVINDGDMGSNILAKNRNIPSLFVTNQYKPKLWKRRMYFYPSMVFVAKQIAKATKILVADSPPPYTICEYNLNFPKKLKDKITFVGHFIDKKKIEKQNTDLVKLVKDEEFGYWMRTGDKSTNDATGNKYEKIFLESEMLNEKRIISHARNDPKIDSVKGRDGKRYSISEAYEKKIDWIQIDVGFLSEFEKDYVIDQCRYAVVNGSHTVLGEIIGVKSKPIIGIPVYDEHTNQIKWAQENNLGLHASTKKDVIKAISKIKNNYAKFEESLQNFSSNFNANGTENTAKIVSEILEDKR